jgi:UDP-N-acetylmuramyl tripeptide synthase
VALACPVDLPLAATSVVEEAAGAGPGEDAVAAEVARLARPALRAFVAAAQARGLSCLVEGDQVVVGQGRHARVLAADALPDTPPLCAGIPFAFVTGTNGKTTTTRLISRMAESAGVVAGHTSSDGIRVGDQWRTHGDWTGPQAARRLLADPQVELAVLETARGGLMRRGLVTGGARCAVITNVTEDHLGEWGLCDVDDLADCKLIVARGLASDGALVVSGDDPAIARALSRAGSPARVLRFRDGSSEGASAWAVDGRLYLDGEPLIDEADLRIAAGGLVRHNVRNALAAALAADVLGIRRSAIADALAAFGPDAADSRGRMNLYGLRGARIVVDFCHTPDAVAGFLPLVRQAGRTTVVVGQAGDRTDALIDSLGAAVAALGAHRVVLKELPGHLRGREPGEVTRRLRARLERPGGPRIEEARDEREAAERAIADCGPDDVVLLFSHEDHDGVVAVLRQAGAAPLAHW